MIGTIKGLLAFLGLVLLAPGALIHAQANSTTSDPVLPSAGMVFAAVEGDPVVQVHGAETKYNPHAAGNIMRGLVYAGPESSVEVEGKAAATRLSSQVPTLYVRLSGNDPDILRNRVMLVSVTPTKATRVIAVYTANAFGGHRKRYIDEVPVTKADTNDPQWLKLTPATPLEPGQYAVVILPKDTLAVPDTVYDFTVLGDPKPKH